MRLIARDFVLVTGSRAVDGAVRFLTVPLVLAYFGRADFGLIALAFSMQAFLAVADFGFSMNAIRRLSGLLKDQDYAQVDALARAAAFFYACVGSVNLVLLLVVGWYGAAWFELSPHHAEQFFWMMAALGLSSAVGWAFSIHRQILQAAGLVGWDEAINLGGTLAMLLATWATLQFEFSPAVYFALVLLPAWIPIMLRARKVVRMVPRLRIGFVADWQRFKPLVGTSLWLFVLMAGELIANHVRPLMLAREAGLEQVAEFRVLQQIAGFALLLLSGVMSVVYPTIARLDAANAQARIDAVLTVGSRLLLWGHIGLLVTMAFLSELILRAYVGAEFVHLAPALAIWLVSLVAYHNSILSSLVIARGSLAPITIGAVVNALASLVLLQLLAAEHGVFAAVWAYTTYLGAQLAVMYLIAAPMAGAGSGLRLALRVLTVPLASGLVCASVAVLVVSSGGQSWWYGALIFAPTFLLCAVTYGGVSRDWVALRTRPA